MVALGSSYASTSALRALQATSKEMATAQSRIATGLKVNQASDDPVVWSIATQLRSSIKANDTFKTNLSTASAQTKLTTNALGQVDKNLREIRTKVEEYLNTATTTDRKTAIASEISNLQKDISEAVKTAKYNGKNWLEETGDFKIVSGQNMSINIDVETGKHLSGTTGLLEADSVASAVIGTNNQSLLEFGTGAMNTDFANLQIKLNAAIDAVGLAQTNFAAAQNSIDSRLEFMSNVNDILSGQLGELVNADLDEEAAKLSALQVKQQLATTALQIINQSQLNVLRLFQ